ncbi:hypothetical protein DB43_AO00090 [Parachlamydia acanthamoebae]|nr:hypothetical protein DB43_AO00090 [Parachlamydia acanthamoebae]
MFLLRVVFMNDTSIKIFLEWFSNNAEDYFYFEKNQDVLFSNLHASLSKVHPDLVFEFSQVLEDGTKELVISADGIKSLFPIVVNLVSQAPFFKKWTIIAFRQPRNFTQIIYQNVKINLSDAFFKYEKWMGKSILNYTSGIFPIPKSGRLPHLFYSIIY